MTLGMFVFGLGQSPLAGLGQRRKSAAMPLTLYSQLPKKPSSYVSSSHMGSAYHSVCTILRPRKCVFPDVLLSSWARCWQGCLFRLGTYIIPSVTMVFERSLLRRCRRRGLFIHHQPSLHFHLWMAHQGGWGRVRGFRTSHGSEEAISCQHDRGSSHTASSRQEKVQTERGVQAWRCRLGVRMKSV